MTGKNMPGREKSMDKVRKRLMELRKWHCREREEHLLALTPRVRCLSRRKAQFLQDAVVEEAPEKRLILSPGTFREVERAAGRGGTSEAEAAVPEDGRESEVL